MAAGERTAGSLRTDGYRLLWEDPGPAGVTFLSSRGVTAELSYAELGRNALAVAAGLRAAGVRAGDRAVLALPPEPDYVSVLVGCYVSGVAPCTVALPGGVGGTGESAFLANVAAARPAVVVAEREDAVPGHATVTAASLVACEPVDPTTLPQLAPDDIHHVQLTSGSTSTPKAVLLTRESVSVNVQIILDNLGTDHPSVLTWTPMYHDMGLAQLHVALARRAPLWLLSRFAFLRDPLLWLRAMSDTRATHTGAPTFALRACLTHAQRRGLPDMDLSSVRRIFVGAEQIPLDALTEFHAVFAERGLARDALYPCYGMAETVVATAVPRRQSRDPGREGSWVRARRVDPDAVRREGVARPAAPGGPSAAVVGLGSAVPGLELTVRDPGGGVRGELEVGEIWLRGSSVMAGYLDGDAEPSGLTADGWYRTGDLGFVDDECDVFILGRLKEVVIVRGHNFAPEAIEDVVESIAAVGPGAAIVFACAGVGEQDRVVAVVESRVKPEDVDGLALQVATNVREAFGFNLNDVVVVGSGVLPRTTSGKRQRVRCRELYLAGELRTKVRR